MRASTEKLINNFITLSGFLALTISSEGGGFGSSYMRGCLIILMETMGYNFFALVGGGGVNSGIEVALNKGLKHGSIVSLPATGTT